MSEDHNERRLAQEGRFPPHVRSCKNEELIRGRIHVKIVGNERAALEFNHGMASLLDADLVALNQLGADVIILYGHFSQRSVDVELPEQTCRSLDPPRLSGDSLSYLVKKVFLQFRNALFGAENLLFVFLKLLGHKSLTVHQGLLAAVTRGDLGQIGPGYLDGISEDLIEFDFERLDPGSLALPSFQ